MEECDPTGLGVVWWPRWMMYVFAGVATALAIAVAFEHRPVYSVGVRVALSAVPAVLWTLCALTKWPPFVVRAVVVFACVGALLVHPAQTDFAPFFFVLLICDAVSESTRAAGAVALAAAALAIPGEISGRFHGSLIWVMALAFTWAGAALVQSRMRLLDVVSERAVAEERQRIARELHDVVAHSLAVTMLQLTGARLALERDPEDAKHALAEAERLGRESLAEIRRTVGLLAPSEASSMNALPSAADVPGLVQDMHDAGLSVTLHCTGDLTAVAPGPGLALYRIVQESLSNVVKHAPGSRASVDVGVVDGVVELRVQNPMARPGTSHTSPESAGMGLHSMRERAESLGGTFDAGVRDDGWCVAAVIPRELHS